MLRSKLWMAFSLALGSISLIATPVNAAVPTIANSSSTSTSLTINGTNLGGGTATVTLGSSAPLTVTSQTATKLDVTLPGGVVAGDYTLNLQIGSKTNSVSSVVTIGAVGPAGPAGPAGPPGVAGPTGAAGATGATGTTGVQGPAGPIGPMGAQGPKGDAGAQGAQGSAGPTGATGAQGPKGDTGSQGSQGAIGATGPQGIAGPEGPKGAPGGPTLSLVDANGTVVGPIFAANGQGSSPSAMATIGGERLPITFGFGNHDENWNPLGPELDLAPPYGYLVFASTDCTGTPYIPRSVVAYEIGATKPFIVFSNRPQIAIYVASSWAVQTVANASVLYPDAPNSGSLATCLLSSGEGPAYAVDAAPISPNWTYPFSVQ